jgi:AraC family transcriptional regulator
MSEHIEPGPERKSPAAKLRRGRPERDTGRDVGLCQGALTQTIGSSCPRSGSDRWSATDVEISPSGAVERQWMAGRGIRAELVQSMSRSRIEFRYRGPSHLILAYEQGLRRGGETFVDGVSPSTLRDFTGKLTFLPAGHDYFEWHQLHASASLLYVYFDPAELDVQSALTNSDRTLSPRLFFEDASLWSTVEKLKGVIMSAGRENLPYFEALGAVLMHELLRLGGRRTGPGEAPARGGLAAWQRRLVASYIEEHLSDHISLATLARLVRLSPYHFSRAFKQSFGMPPHRYHTYRRIESAKILLEKHALSVTDIGLSLGFNETSSFTTTFRKITGLTPSRYHRSTARLPAQN